jgi:hypothetical protein
MADFLLFRPPKIQEQKWRYIIYYSEGIRRECPPINEAENAEKTRTSAPHL